jgi:steroid 5-alpha reductase family enzyme
MNAWVLTGFGLNVVMIMMALAWVIARRVKNASCLDVASSCGFAVVACLYAAIGPGDLLRKWLIAGMVTIGSLRLASLLLLDLIRNHPREAERYRALREHFPKRPWLMFFGFSQYLAALIAVLSVPFAIVCSNPSSRLGAAEIAASILWLAAICGDTVAKGPLTRFLANRRASGRTPRDRDLSRYSLHPDYLSEWLVWFAYFLFALGSPWGWATFYCPLIVFYSLTTAKALLPRPPAPRIQSRLKESGDA